MQRNVLFDFDGVIADSFTASHDAALRICAHLDEETFRGNFDGNIHDNYDAAMKLPHGEECAHHLEYFEQYAPLFETRAKPFVGIADVLGSLASEYTLFLVTSARRIITDPFLQKHNFGRHFREVMTMETHRNKDEKIRMIFDKYKIQPDECVFITDTLGDVREAKNVGVGAIGVSWGFHDRARLEQGVPFRIVDKPSELPDTVEDYFANFRAGS